MMPKIVLQVALSADGFIADEHGGVDWLPHPDSTTQDYGMTVFEQSVDVIVMGAVTYKQMLGFGDTTFFGKPTFVFTCEHLKSEFSNVTFVSGDVINVMNNISHSLKPQVVWLFGGADLIIQFYGANLIDEYLLTFFPVALGQGIALPADVVQGKEMHLAQETRFDDGAIQKHFVKMTKKNEQ